MTLDQLLEALLGTKGSFESALSRVREVDTKDLIIRLLQGLEKEEHLDNTERERRLGSVFGRASVNPEDLLSIGEAGAMLRNAILRNALAQLLPPEFRSLVFRPKDAVRQKSPEPQITSAEEIQLSEDLAAEVPSDAEAHTAFSDVIVLSISDDPATKKLLGSAGFVMLRCQTIDELNKMLETNEEICAFLVENSFLTSLDERQQSALITKLACFSTFVWLRFQEDGLIADNLSVGQRIASDRCRTSPPDVTELSFRDGAGLQERELPALRSAQMRLGEGEAHGRFIPGELTAFELKLLGAAMSQYSKRRRFNPGAELTQVTTKFLQGGQTGARVALVKVNDLQVPVIVKLHQKEFILDEARRFLTFIHKDNLELNPEVHLHAGAALIVFGVIPDAHAEAEQPAPTLEQRLTDFWYEEMREPMGSGNGALLLKGFTDAARRLSALNQQKCFNKNFRCMANPYLIGIKAMEKKGFDWGFPERALTARERAENLLAGADQIAICHGDAHTRNVLIRGEQGFLIDYAYSGPGHPCSDLIRLELSVYLTRFVQLGGDVALDALQRDLSVERLPLDDLLLSHKSILRSKTNQLCLKMCVIARDLVTEVLAAHKLPWEHYIAVKLLTSWQALQVPNLQQFLARSVISAIGT